MANRCAQLADCGAQAQVGQGTAPWPVLTGPEGHEFHALAPS
ncbi:hypothetical protein [Streptomyces sp. MK37H]|nr:hypothetical protein [Streptomyces sp. MK37H]